MTEWTVAVCDSHVTSPLSLQAKSQPPLSKMASGSKGDTEGKSKSGRGASGGGAPVGGASGGERDRDRKLSSGASPKTTLITIKVGVVWMCEGLC